MRVSIEDLIAPELRGQISQEHTFNLNILFHEVNVLREASNLPFVIRNNTDRKRAGYRTEYMHQELYAEINARRHKANLPPLRVPEKSWHLEGAAADIWDPAQEFQGWIKKNELWVRGRNVAFEHFSATPTWVHIQIYYPKSLNQFFMP